MVPEQCDLGFIQFRYRRDHPLISVLNGHGVRLDGHYVLDHCGTLDVDTPTLIDGPGGTGVERGDLITHDAAACAEGLYQAGR